MIRLAIAAVVVLAISATTASLSAQTDSVSLGLDLQTEGNTGSSLGGVEACRTAETGESFDIDVWIKGVPVYDETASTGGIAGFAYNLHFDPTIVRVTAVNNDLMLGSSSPFQRIDADYRIDDPDLDSLPSTSGDMRVDFVDLSLEYESGDGVMSRITLETVGAGITGLVLDSEIEQLPSAIAFDNIGNIYPVSSKQDARLAVGQPCEGAPTASEPSITPVATQPGETPATPSPTPSPVPSSVPGGETALAVDVVPTGNAVTELGEIDTCAAAEVNDQFKVDIVITGVTDLLAFQVPISYDRSVLRIDDRSVDFLLDSTLGSEVNDSSAATPDSSGLYTAAAVDVSDPAAADSGDGVLVRLIVTAIGEGESELGIDQVDRTSDGIPDVGVLIKNQDNAAIGDENGDSLFDGPTAGATIRVGESCADGGRVVTGEVNETPRGNGSGGDDGGSSWLLIAAIVAAAAVVVGGGAALLMRRRGSGPP